MDHSGKARREAQLAIDDIGQLRTLTANTPRRQYQR